MISNKSNKEFLISDQKLRGKFYFPLFDIVERSYMKLRSVVRMLEHMKETGKPFSQRELAREVGVSSSTVNYWLPQLRASGLISKISEGDHKGKHAFFTWDGGIEELKKIVKRAVKESLDPAELQLRVKQAYYERGEVPPSEMISDLVQIELQKKKVIPIE